jgi:hypothetical protein
MEDMLAKNKRKEVASMIPSDDALFFGCGTDL